MASTDHHYSHQLPRHHPNHEPQRLSGIYQYHNAPEVLPEHGLEYDENVYPVSDKYPVTSMDDYPSSWNHKYRDTAAKPPRIIFGMKVRSFMLVALVFVLIVVGAVVGGTVGRNQVQTATDIVASDQSAPTATSISSSEASGVRTILAASPSSTPSTTQSTTQSTPLSTPTFSPLSACPSANDTIYASPLLNTTTTASSSSNTTTLTFTRYCAVSAPSNLVLLTTAFVYTLDDCIDLCASFNVYAEGESRCGVAVYDVLAQRPGNCIVGSVEAGVRYEDLAVSQAEGVAVALAGAKD